jgi:hypothetical protein
MAPHPERVVGNDPELSSGASIPELREARDQSAMYRIGWNAALDRAVQEIEARVASWRVTLDHQLSKGNISQIDQVLQAHIVESTIMASRLKDLFR